MCQIDSRTYHSTELINRIWERMTFERRTVMADIEMLESIPCRFKLSWQGKCGKPSTNGWCSKHEKLKCCSCGAKATKDCEHTSSLVCGAPLCDTCGHSLEDDSHVTKEVLMGQIESRQREETATEQSRNSANQRLDNEGNPANLFELLKKDPKDQGYRLEKVFFLQLEHSLWAFLPAVIHSKKRIIMCLDQALLVEIWKTLEPRRSRMNSHMCWVNEQRGIAYANVVDQDEQERTRPEKLLTRDEYEKIPKEGPESIKWAPGLIGGKYIDDRDQFSRYIDQQVACS